MADLMNPGGGLTKSKLLLANANPSDVSQGKSFYSNGNKELQTGTLVERGTSQNAGGIGSGGSGSSAYIAFNRIPEGIYRANGTDWGPEIRANLDDVLNTLIHSTVAWNSVKPGDNQNETWKYSIQRGTVWVMVVQGTGQDANTVAGCSISTPNCTTLFDVNVNVTTNPSNATRPLKIRGFRANADTTVSGYTMCGTGHAARYFGLYRIV